ncbi:MAG: phosphoglucosamine mutase, partial [Pseudomonadota bacterium]
MARARPLGPLRNLTQRAGTTNRATMSRTLFGTDGIRGRANSHPMTSEVAL